MGNIISGKPQIERDVMVILQLGCKISCMGGFLQLREVFVQQALPLDRLDGWWYIQVTLRCS